MRWRARALRHLPVAAVAVGVALAISGLDNRDLALRLGGTMVGAAVTAVVVRRMPSGADGAESDAFEAVWHRAAGAQSAPDPPERERLRTTVRLSLSAAGDAHSRLRPLLAELADARLDAVYGTHIDSDPRAAERLGPQMWELVRPDRPQPAERLSPGPMPADLETAVADLERLGGAEQAHGTGASGVASDPEHHDRLEAQ